MIILITGVMAAGKSTVAQAVAERLEKSVHLRGDVFRRMIVSGRVEMGADKVSEAHAQLRLRYRAAAEAAKIYHASGFDVVYQDVMIGSVLAEVVELYCDLPLHVVVLCPRANIVSSREQTRQKTGYGAYSVAELDGVLKTKTPKVGLWLDNSDLSIVESADHILARLGEAKI